MFATTFIVCLLLTIPPTTEYTILLEWSPLILLLMIFTHLCTHARVFIYLVAKHWNANNRKVLPPLPPQDYKKWVSWVVGLQAKTHIQCWLAVRPASFCILMSSHLRQQVLERQQPKWESNLAISKRKVKP